MKAKDIKKLRDKLGLTQERFAALLKTTVVTINRWENEKCNPGRVFIDAMEKLDNGD